MQTLIFFLSYFSICIIMHMYYIFWMLASKSDFEDRMQITCRWLSSAILQVETGRGKLSLSDWMIHSVWGGYQCDIISLSLSAPQRIYIMATGVLCAEKLLACWSCYCAASSQPCSKLHAQLLKSAINFGYNTLDPVSETV